MKHGWEHGWEHPKAMTGQTRQVKAGRGIYVLLGPFNESFIEQWRCLVLEADPDDGPENVGSILIVGEPWLIKQTRVV